MTTTAPTTLAAMLAEIKAKIYQNGIGAITAKIVQTVLSDMLAVLGFVATTEAIAAADAEVAALTPGLVATAASAGSQAGQSAGAAAGVASAAPYASAALAYETAAQAILNSYLDDGVQGLSPAGASFDDGVQQ